MDDNQDDAFKGPWQNFNTGKLNNSIRWRDIPHLGLKAAAFKLMFSCSTAGFILLCLGVGVSGGLYGCVQSSRAADAEKHMKIAVDDLRDALRRKQQTIDKLKDLLKAAKAASAE